MSIRSKFNFKNVFKWLINKWLKAIFIINYNSDAHRKLRSLITSFYDHYDSNYSFNTYRITKCMFYNFPNYLLVEIHSLSPGMIIGERGNCLDRLKDFIQKRYPEKTIKISLEETNPFKP